MAVTSDQLDPDEVYLVGTIIEGSCGYDVIAHWSSPDSAAAGFDCYFDEDTAMIRAPDGRLLYTNTYPVLREFHCDGCPLTLGNYPSDPLANDLVIATPGCDPGVPWSMRFLLSPEATVLHRCDTDGVGWRDQSGAVVYDEAHGALIHLGYGDLAITDTSIVHLASGTAVPIVGSRPE